MKRSAEQGQLKSKTRQPQPVISEEMKAWSTALEGETASWPRITERSFFGFTALYRGDKMFGCLPRTRNLEVANTIAFKLHSRSPKVEKQLQCDSRISSFEKEKSRWFTFLLSSDADLHGALEWLSVSYEAAAKHRKTK